MSAESSGEEGGPIKVHKPEWQSNSEGYNILQYIT